MAKKKMVPCERFLRFKYVHPGNGTETSVFIDIARELSKLNRRFYRQGKVYQIANISVTSRNTTGGYISCISAGDTWVTRSAWTRGKNMYEAMNKQVLDMPGSSKRKGRYHDYKVYLLNEHRTGTQLQVVDSANTTVKAGEWKYSRFSTPDGTTTNDLFWTGLYGAHVGASPNREYVGLIQSYGESRPTVNKEEPQMDTDGSDDPLLNLFDSGSHIDETAELLEIDYDEPPYGYMNGSDEGTIGDYYPGAASNCAKPLVRRLASFGQAGGSNAPTIMLPGFTAIAGLVEFELSSDNTEPDEIDIIVELAPGNYKGVAAFDI